MTTIRALLFPWFAVLTVSILLASADGARAEQDDDGNDNIWFGESVSSDISSQSTGPGFWGTVRSLLGLGETRRETPLNATREAEPVAEKAALPSGSVRSGGTVTAKEDPPVSAAEEQAEVQPVKGEEADARPAAGTVSPPAGESGEATPWQEEPPARGGSAPKNSTVTKPDRTDTGPSSGDILPSAAGPGADLPFSSVREPGASPEAFGQEYVVGPGDQLGISVWRDDMLTKTVLVLPDGKITYPLIGELVVGGKTLGEIKKELTNKLATYVVDADISVEVRQSNSLFVYIIGRVNAPGRQMLLADTTVLQALAMAGGLNPFADEDDIKVFRREKEKTLMYRFRYSHVAEGRHLEDNILLKRGDVLFVP